MVLRHRVPSVAATAFTAPKTCDTGRSDNDDCVEHRNHVIATTFAEIRCDAEKRLMRGLQLDIDQIMVDIELLRTRAERPIKN